MNRSEALTIVRDYIKNENLVRHMLAVEAAMQFYAEKYDQDVETWGITGLLHDFDWEIHPNSGGTSPGRCSHFAFDRRARGNCARRVESRRPHRRSSRNFDGKSSLRL